MTFIDTNVILRHLVAPSTHDAEVMTAKSRRLFERIANGQETATTCEAIICEIVYVLGSPRLYNLSAADISARLKPIIELPGFFIEHKRRYLRALDIFVTYALRLDFEDALSVAYVEHDTTPVLYSFDRGFDRVQQIERREP